MSAPLLQLCARASRGEGEVLRTVLRLLAGRTIFAPVSVMIDVQDAKGTSRVKVVTLQEGTRRTVPIFTSEEFLREWAKGEYESLPLSGGDLALTLPASTWVIVDPGQIHSLQLSPNEVEELANVEVLTDEEWERDASETARAEQEALLQSAAAKVFNREELLSSLTSLFSDYPDVLEAYFLDSQGEPAGGVLGLLTRSLPVDARFELMSRIGGISRDYFGSTGAIEPYDDLNAPNAGTWELFKTLPPFYTKDENDGRSHYSSYLNAKVEEAFNASAQAGDAGGSWTNTVRNIFKRRAAR